ncbi:MAG: ECF transporter S component [Eubacteriaceae bacterium]
MNQTVKKITYTSLMIAIVFLCTVVIPFPSPLGGYINLGDAAIYISSFILGPVLGFLAGGLGSMLGDFSLGYFIYMIPTFLIKGLMGYISGYLFKKNQMLLGVLSGLLIMIIGYYGAEILIFNNLLSPLANIPFNLIQGSIGAIAGYVLIKVLKNSKIKIHI